MKFFNRKNKTKINKSSSNIKTKSICNSNNDYKKLFKNIRKGQFCPISVIMIYLKRCGLVEYLQSPAGGKRDSQSIHQTLQRVDSFLNFNYLSIYKTRCIPISFDVELFFKQVIRIHYNNIPEYISFLEEKKALSVSSQLNYLYDIQRSVHWFCLFRKTHNNVVSSSSYTRWIDCIRNIKKPLHHSLSLQRAKGNSIEEKVYQSEYPEGGLNQLQNCIKSEMKFIESFDTPDLIFIDKSTYNRFTGILYSAIYAFGIQGRISG